MSRFAAALSFCFLLALPARAFADEAPAPAPAAAGAIVKGKDDDAITTIMRSFTKALKVKCNHCHVREDGKFDYKKWTKKKRVALYMHTEFVQKLKTAEGGAVICNTCHGGRRNLLKRVGKGD